MAIRTVDLRTGAGTLDGRPVHYHIADTDAEKPSSGLNTGDLLFAADTGRSYVARNTSVWQAHMWHPMTFSKSMVILNPGSAVNVAAWLAPFSCTVAAIYGLRVGGTGVLVNARKNGSLTHLASDLSVTSAGSWMGGGAVQNTVYSIGDRMEFMVASLSGSPEQVAIEVEFTRP